MGDYFLFFILLSSMANLFASLLVSRDVTLLRCSIDRLVSFMSGREKPD